MITYLVAWFVLLSAGCSERFAGGQAPVFTMASVAAPHDATICFQTFAVYHSEKTRTPLWSAEHLTRQVIQEAKQMHREGNEFHEEGTIPAQYRAWLRDYVRSGYDRGHLTPSGNQPNLADQQETFTLANVVPQGPKLNRGLWSEYESGVREMALQLGEVFVVTGTLYEGSQIQRIGGRTLVPTSIYKAVYSPTSLSAGAVVCENNEDGSCLQVTLEKLETRAGVKLFPGATIDRNRTLEIESKAHGKRGWR